LHASRRYSPPPHPQAASHWTKKGIALVVCVAIFGSYAIGLTIWIVFKRY
jgi:hypothetical protein